MASLGGEAFCENKAFVFRMGRAESGVSVEDGRSGYESGGFIYQAFTVVLR